MADIRSKLNEVYSLEQLASGASWLHRRHAGVKMLTALIYILCVISLERHSIGRLTPFLIFPVMVIAASGIPVRMIIRRSAVALPFCIFAGVSGLIIERDPWLLPGGIVLTEGTAAFIVLMLRTLLCVSAVLILTALTPFHEITAQLKRLHVPVFFVTLFEMIYRYLGVLAEEAYIMLTAYRLRGDGVRWPHIRHAGAFIGQLLLRSNDRAERIYNAMKCRGYGWEHDKIHDKKTFRQAEKTVMSNAIVSSETSVPNGNAAYMPAPEEKISKKIKTGDLVFLLAGCGSSVLFRIFDLPSVLGTLMV